MKDKYEDMKFELDDEKDIMVLCSADAVYCMKTKKFLGSVLLDDENDKYRAIVDEEYGFWYINLVYLPESFDNERG